jgi:hypothetical protein
MSDSVQPIPNPYYGMWDYQYNANTGVPFATNEHPTPEQVADFDARGIVHLIAAPCSNYIEFYVSNGVLEPLTAMGLTVSKTVIKDDGSDAATISGIPANCVVTVDNIDHSNAVANGVFTFTASEEGSYLFRFSADTYLNNSVSITAQ